MNNQFYKHKIIRSLLDELVPLDEAMKAFNIHTSCADTGDDVLGFVYYSKKGNFHIVVNEQLPEFKRKQVFLHEIKHIILDIPKKPYFIGLDMQRTEFEMTADKVAEALVSYGA